MAWSVTVLLTLDADPIDCVVLKRGSVVSRLLGLRVLIPHRVYGNLSVVAVVCCQVEISVSN